MNSVLDSVRDVVVVNASAISLEISIDLRDRPQSEMRRAFAGSSGSGYFYMHRMPKFPDTVMETVVSRVHGDGITSLYKNHRIFSELNELLVNRTRLINAVAAAVGLPPESVGIDDEVRGRMLGLQELGTGQLIDMLQSRAHGGIVLLKTDNYANVAVQA